MLSLICNRASICKQSVKALMGISTEFYSDKIDINFIDLNAKSLWPFSTFVNQVLKFYSHFSCSERLRKFPIKYGDLYICGRGVRKLPVQYWHRNHCCICFVGFVMRRLRYWKWHGILLVLLSGSWGSAQLTVNMMWLSGILCLESHKACRSEVYMNLSETDFL